MLHGDSLLKTFSDFCPSKSSLKEMWLIGLTVMQQKEPRDQELSVHPNLGVPSGTIDNTQCGVPAPTFGFDSTKGSSLAFHFEVLRGAITCCLDTPRVFGVEGACEKFSCVPVRFCKLPGFQDRGAGSPGPFIVGDPVTFVVSYRKPESKISSGGSSLIRSGLP